MLVDTDEGVRPGTTAESLAALKPAFDKAGTVTAGNASQISDGGAAVIVMSRAKADALGVPPSVRSWATGRLPVPTRRCCCSPPTPRPGSGEGGQVPPGRRPVRDQRGLRRRRPHLHGRAGITEEVTNVNGGAIALGHPIGMSGTRLALTMLNEFKRRGGGIAAASLCGGGGQGDALLVRTLP